jgi:glycosyltransferase involved in cell wall biosynthesis
MVGTAQLHVHNLPIDPSLFRRTLGWRPRLLRSWARGAVGLAREVQPQLIRCHGAHLNAFAAAEIRRLAGVPYVVSMHTNPDELRDRAKNSGDLRARFALEASSAVERIALSHADCVVCVYHFIEPYARRMGARRIEVIYNVVNETNLLAKDSYALGSPAHIVVPGRQLDGKDPRPVVEALANLPGVRCTFIGDGPLHEATVALAERIGVNDRCEFRRTVPNDELCRSLRDYDVLVSVNDYGGVSKVELEAALVGMPIVTNQHPLERVPEILGEACLTVSGSLESYVDALQRLLIDEPLRRRLGSSVRQDARAVSPPKMEEDYAALYCDLLGAGSAASDAPAQG